MHEFCESESLKLAKCNSCANEIQSCIEALNIWGAVKLTKCRSIWSCTRLYYQLVAEVGQLTSLETDLRLLPWSIEKKHKNLYFYFLDVDDGHMNLFKQPSHFGPTGRHVCWPKPTNKMLISFHSSLNIQKKH